MSSRKAARLTIADVEGQLRRIAPPELAQPGDNVGLLAGDPAWPCRAVLLCIDLTEDVLIEARRAGSGLIVAYHPPIFKPVSRITTEADGPEAMVCAALADRTGIYAMHTALDAAEGGTNDVMAGLCGLADCQPFGPAGSGGYKVVVFVPPEAVDRVREAM
ncbi:MAG: Nif3-like dinuclear metal center hexameric protein, partial [Phycisphaerae bacterium]